MLAEIFIMRLEAVARALKEATPAKDARFVPFVFTDTGARIADDRHEGATQPA